MAAGSGSGATVLLAAEPEEPGTVGCMGASGDGWAMLPCEGPVRDWFWVWATPLDDGYLWSLRRAPKLDAGACA